MRPPETLDEYNRDSDFTPPSDTPPRWPEIACDVAVAILIGSLLACLSGCYGSPIDTRNIDADKVTITHSTPWSTLTIQAEGWHSAVKTLQGETDPSRRQTNEVTTSTKEGADASAPAKLSTHASP